MPEKLPSPEVSLITASPRQRAQEIIRSTGYAPPRIGDHSRDGWDSKNPTQRDLMDPPEAPSMPELVQEMHNLHIPLSNQEGEDKTSAIDSDDENISDGKMAPPKESSTPVGTPPGASVRPAMERSSPTPATSNSAVPPGAPPTPTPVTAASNPPTGSEGDGVSQTSPLIPHTAKASLWRIRPLRTPQQSPEEIAELFREIQRKTNIVSNGRTITVPRLTCDMDGNMRAWVQRALFLSVMPEGAICVLDGPFPQKGFKLLPMSLEDKLRTLTDLDQMTLSSFIYVRSSAKYWFAPDTMKGDVEARGNGYLIQELPRSMITPTFRSGYLVHLHHERAEDEITHGTDFSRESHRLRVTQVTSWIEQDPGGELPSLQAFLARKESHEKPAEDAMDLDSAEANHHSQSGEEVEGDSEGEGHPEESLHPLPGSVPYEGNVDLDPRGIRFLVNRPLKDAGRLREAEEFQSELLKLKPNLKACLRCGERSHSSERCTRSQNRAGSQPPAEEMWYNPNPESVGALGANGFRCVYPYCREATTHALAACPSLHERCARCYTRGHNDQVWDYPGKPGFFLTNCPYLAQDRNSLNPDATHCPSWHDLLAHFEACATTGVLTKYRFHSIGCGFYPARGEGDLEVIRALGYRWLSQLKAKDAMRLLATIHALCINAFGDESLRYSAIRDADWDSIFKQRENKRSLDLEAQHQTQPKGNNKPKSRKHSPSAKRLALPQNAPRSGYYTAEAGGNRKPFRPPKPNGQPPVPLEQPPSSVQEEPASAAPTPTYGAAKKKVPPRFGYVRDGEMERYAALPPSPPIQDPKGYRIPKRGKK